MALSEGRHFLWGPKEAHVHRQSGDNRLGPSMNQGQWAESSPAEEEEVGRANAAGHTMPGHARHLEESGCKDLVFLPLSFRVTSPMPSSWQTPRKYMVNSANQI